MRIKITNEILEKSIEMYEEGYTIKYISELFNLKPDTLYSRLKSSGVDIVLRRSNMIPQSKLDIIYEMHKSGKSLRYISSKFNISYSSLYSNFTRNGITILKNLDDIRKGKTVDDFFSSIDRPDKAYILGLLMADGYIYRNVVSLKLAEKDIETLKYVKNSLSEGKNLHRDVSSFKRVDGSDIISYSISITSDQMVKDLSRLGVIPNKTGYEIIPVLDESMYKHFVRGFFDGDGSISSGKKTQASICCSNKNLLIQLQKLLGFGNIYTTSKNRKVPLHTINFRSKDYLSKLYLYMYDSESYKMRRKFVIFDSWFKQQANTEVNNEGNTLLSP
ncbi:MAG TPA: LAGLIDADG family homing endonuclease [Tissierellaceae bacterium]|nr:LAGLIDADG family homing endonuclease [Tissierellaceae bacterium]